MDASSETKRRATKTHFVPALGLFLLAPLVGEFLLGNLPITSIGAVSVSGTTLWRRCIVNSRSGRRWQLGWPGMIVLCFAYGLVEEAFVTQSLFNPNYVGLRLLDYGYISSLGISAWWTVLC